MSAQIADRFKLTRVTSLLDTEDALDPSDDLVRRGVRGLVKVDASRLNVGLEVTLERRASGGDRGEVARTDKELVVVLQEERPLAGVELGRNSLRLDGEVARLLDVAHGRHLDQCCLRGEEGFLFAQKQKLKSRTLDVSEGAA